MRMPTQDIIELLQSANDEADQIINTDTTCLDTHIEIAKRNSTEIQRLLKVAVKELQNR